MSLEPVDPEAAQPEAPQQATAAPAGWYPVGENLQRYWDGANWTEHRAPMRAEPPQIQGVPLLVPTYQMNQPTMAVTYSKRHTSHTFHLIMTILTAGVWGVLVWLPMTIINNLRKEKSVTRYR